MKIILLGSFAGNNAGDMVVLESIINDFNHILLEGVRTKENSIFAGLESVVEFEMVIPTLNERGLKFLNNTTSIQNGLQIIPIPISKNPIVVIRALKRLVKEFSEADYIYTTAGILFDQKIWNPFYNFVIVYTPLLAWAKYKNSNVNIIGYNVGITSKSKTVGKFFLKKCIGFHDCIYLREKRDAMLLEKVQYKGNTFISADNVFGYGMPEMRGNQQSKKIYMNLTLYGVSDKKKFICEITRFINRIKSEYEICFFQTSKRDLKIAKEICEQVHLEEKSIFYLGLMGYSNIKNLLLQCDLLIGMRMHSLIFALKGGCPIIAIGYSQKVTSMMRDAQLEEFLIAMNALSEEILLSKMAVIIEHRESIQQKIYEEVKRRYLLCDCYK